MRLPGAPMRFMEKGMSDPADQIRVEIVYALPDEQKIFSFHLPEGATVRQGIEQSGILEKYPEMVDVFSAAVHPMEGLLVKEQP